MLSNMAESLSARTVETISDSVKSLDPLTISILQPLAGELFILFMLNCKHHIRFVYYRFYEQDYRNCDSDHTSGTGLGAATVNWGPG